MNIKKIIAGLLACCAVGGTIPSAVCNNVPCAVTANAETNILQSGYKQLTYAHFGDHIEITGCSKEATEIEIPAEIDGVPVTHIRNRAFQYKTNLTSVIIPDSIISIGDYAFTSSYNLKSVTIPESVTNFGAYSFEQTAWLDDRRQENPLVAVNNILIDGKTCTGDVVIPDNVKIIGNSAFATCEGITSVTIPDSVTTIDNYAFSCCLNLSSIDIPKSVTNIGLNPFFSTAWIEDRIKENPLVVVNNILVDGTTCTGDVVIPDNVKIIGEYAFSYCEGLTSVTLPDSVTTIGEYAFWNCTGLTSAIIPYGVTTISPHAFEVCESLTSITIPDSVTSIGIGAFYFCKSLTSVTIPDGVTTINGSTFSRCESLKSVTIPDSVTNIGKYTFYHCKSLTSVIIPENVTSIEEEAFYCCSALTSIEIPESVTYIGDSAFGGCTDLQSITILNPDCYIFNYETTISNGYDKNGYYFNGTIYGYANSTAQEYAEKYGCAFAALDKTTSELTGDVNLDGYVNMSDAAAIIQHIGNKDKYGLTGQGLVNADTTDDGTITTTDAIAIQLLIAKQITKLPYIE